MLRRSIMNEQKTQRKQKENIEKIPLSLLYRESLLNYKTHLAAHGIANMM